jgi:hypothetical protein
MSSLFKNGVRDVGAALRLQRSKRDRWLADKRYLAATNLQATPNHGLVSVAYHLMGAGFEMKSIDDVASLPLSPSTSTGIDRATVWDDGLLERAATDARLFESVLTSGGDERIAIDPATGRNRYGAPPGKACDEVWFSSSTASAISPRGYEAALEALRCLIGANRKWPVSGWFDRIRDRLAALFGIPHTEIILSSSGTELELIALVLSRNILQRPVSNVVIAPTETGRGVTLAAAGRYFLGTAPFAAEVECGRLLDGLEARESKVEIVEIRDRNGVPLSADSVDDAVVRSVEAIIAGGGDAVVHLLDCSKTNRTGLRRATAATLMARYRGRLVVVVDACQLRCSREQIQADLHAGFMVMMTGSKFAGGPPFAGALLLPPSIVARLQSARLPQGLFAYTATNDWPDALRGRLEGCFVAAANVGMGLRWEAALAELERLFALDSAFRARVTARFSELVCEHASFAAGLDLIDRDHEDADIQHRTIFSIVTSDGNGTPLAADVIQRALRTPLQAHIAGVSGRAFHVGQSVAVGDRSALRVCLGAPDITEVGERMRAGKGFDAAFAPLAADVADLFGKWSYVRNRLHLA